MKMIEIPEVLAYAHLTLLISYFFAYCGYHKGKADAQRDVERIDLEIQRRGIKG